MQLVSVQERTEESDSLTMARLTLQCYNINDLYTCWTSEVMPGLG